MNKEKHVKYETSLTLRELGFDEQCRAFWKNWNNSICLYDANRGQAFDYCDNTILEYKYNTSDETNVAAPTIQMAIDWLCEKYNTYVHVKMQDVNFCKPGWTFTVYHVYKDEEGRMAHGQPYDNDNVTVYENFANCADSGIMFACRKIKEQTHEEAPVISSPIVRKRKND